MRVPPKRFGSLGIALSIAILGSWGCRPGTGSAPGGTPLEVSMAVAKVPYSGLIAVAEEKGYFRREGLNVKVRFFPSGREALEAVCRGDALVATVSSLAFAVKAQEDPSIRILASIGTSTGSRIVARKDRGIQEPPDLKGKRIGFSAGTESDYLLYAFLLTEDIPAKAVTMVDLPPARQAEAVLEGKVDAVSAFEVYAFEATKRLGNDAVSWPANVSFIWLLAAREQSLRSTEPLERLLKALVRAADFVDEHEEEARDLLARRWGFDPSFLHDSMQRSRLDVSFNQAVVTSQINYADWYMRRAGKGGKPPDVMEYMNTGILEKVEPESVTLLR